MEPHCLAPDSRPGPLPGSCLSTVATSGRLFHWGTGSLRFPRMEVAPKPHASVDGPQPGRAICPPSHPRLDFSLCRQACIPWQSQAHPSQGCGTGRRTPAAHRAPRLPRTQSIWPHAIPATEPAGYAPTVAPNHSSDAISWHLCQKYDLESSTGWFWPQAPLRDALENSLGKRPWS